MSIRQSSCTPSGRQNGSRPGEPVARPRQATTGPHLVSRILYHCRRSSLTFQCKMLTESFTTLPREDGGAASANTVQEANGESAGLLPSPPLCGRTAVPGSVSGAPFPPKTCSGSDDCETRSSYKELAITAYFSPAYIKKQELPSESNALLGTGWIFGN